MDILPQYIVYLIVSPPLVWLCVKGRWPLVAAGCVIAWTAVQLGLHLPAAAAIDETLALRAHFNVLTWQVLFMRSEEHTSELQSLMRISYSVFCLKKKK